MKIDNAYSYVKKTIETNYCKIKDLKYIFKYILYIYTEKIIYLYIQFAKDEKINNTKKKIYKHTSKHVQMKHFLIISRSIFYLILKGEEV